MNNFRKSQSFFLGITSLIVAIIILVIASFSVLTFVSANNDYKMALKAKEATSEYYEADNKANDTLKEIEQALKNSNYQSLLEGKGFNIVNDARGIIVSFTTKINENKQLLSKVLCSNGKVQEILTWKVVVTR